MGDLIKIELTDFNLTDYYGDTAVGIALSLIKKKKISKSLKYVILTMQ